MHILEQEVVATALRAVQVSSSSDRPQGGGYRKQTLFISRSSLYWCSDDEPTDSLVAGCFSFLRGFDRRICANRDTHSLARSGTKREGNRSSRRNSSVASHCSAGETSKIRRIFRGRLLAAPLEFSRCHRDLDVSSRVAQFSANA